MVCQRISHRKGCSADASCPDPDYLTISPPARILQDRLGTVSDLFPLTPSYNIPQITATNQIVLQDPALPVQTVLQYRLALQHPLAGIFAMLRRMVSLLSTFSFHFATSSLTTSRSTSGLRSMVSLDERN